MNEISKTYRVKGNGGSWSHQFIRKRDAITFLNNVRVKYDKTASLYRVTEIWEPLSYKGDAK